MEIKLKSVFQNHKLRLAVKTLAFAGLLAALKAGEFGFWPIILFFIGVIVAYATPLFRTIELIGTLAVLCADAFFVLSTFSGNTATWLSIIYFSALFYIMLGIKELAFVKRHSWHRILALGLAYPMLLMFFYYGQAGTLLRLGTLFTGFIILTKGAVVRRLPSWLISLLALEVAWAASLLPIGFVSQAGLASLFYFTLMDTSYYHIEGQLTKRIILIHATLLALLTLLVFASSRWSL